MVKAVPADWLAAVSDGSRLDVLAPGKLMADIAVEVFEKDQQRSAAHRSTFHDLAR